MVLQHLAATLALAVCAPAGRAIVAEVYYDAPGEDGGREYVEFFNPSGSACALAGLRLESGDGSAAGRWTLRWTGAAGDSVPAHGRFVVGGALVSPAPDRIATLDLQNGPDAIRLEWPDGGRETVGWGTHEFAEYACGAPATDAPSGSSLARVPDDADFGSNALDVRPAEPSPGRPNQRQRDLAIVRGTLLVRPGQPAPGEALLVSLRVANPGRAPLAAGEALLVLAGDALAESLAASLPGIGAGETLEVVRPAAAGDAGRRALFAHVVLALDEAPASNADTLALRVGPGPLELTEIQFHPAAGEGEWVEVRNRSGVPLVLTGCTLADRSSAGVPLIAAVELAAESLAVLAQDRTALLAAFPGLDSTRVLAVGPWPSFNNSDGGDGTADEVVLRERDGLPADRVPYSAAGVPAGTPLEKRAGVWTSARETRGTPLAFPRDPGAEGGGLTLSPRRLGAHERELALTWTLPWPRGRVTIELYDLAGRRAARLLDEVASGAADTRRVALGELPPGLYVAVLRAHDGARAVTRQETLRVLGSRP